MRPDIYFYNPTCELAVANGSENFMPNQLLRKMEYDLDFLPACYASASSIILTQKFPSEEFGDKLLEAGLGPFHLELFPACLKDPSFINLPKGFLCPWGWSPAMHKAFSAVKTSCSEEFLNSPVADWHPVHKELYSRKEAATLLSSILENSNCDWMSSPEDIPQVCTTQEQIRLLQEKWPRMIVKSPWSSTGRGLQVLRPGEYNQSNQQVISGFLSHQGYVLVEPFYDKLMDLSFQFYSQGNGKIDYLGICSFQTDGLGKYSGSYLEEIPENCSPFIREFITDHLSEIKNRIHQALKFSRYAQFYRGWIGVDTLIYKADKNQIRIQPCIEVNCRYTMGAVVLALRDRIVPGSTGTFQIWFQKQGNPVEFFQTLQLKSPLIREGNKIVKGILQLTPVLNDTNFVAYLSLNPAV